MFSFSRVNAEPWGCWIVDRMHMDFKGPPLWFSGLVAHSAPAPSSSCGFPCSLCGTSKPQ